MRRGKIYHEYPWVDRLVCAVAAMVAWGGVYALLPARHTAQWVTVGGAALFASFIAYGQGYREGRRRR